MSNRSQNIDASGIRRVFDLASTLKNPINLSIGQPDFHASEELKQAAVEAVNANFDRYTPTQGIEPLRERLISKTGNPNAFLSSGVSGGLTLSFLAALDPGDKILIPDPYFCIYRDLAVLFGLEVEYYDLYPSLELSSAVILESISADTKAVVVNSPANPTGKAISQSELDALCRECENRGVWLIYDQIYDEFCYDAPHAVLPSDFELGITLGGFSKSHGVPGWRAGYVAANKKITAEMLKIQQYTFVCTPSITQYALSKCFAPVSQKTLDAYKAKREMVVRGLQDCAEVVKPDGAFYLFFSVPGLSGSEFFEKALSKNLLVVPGNVFSRKDTHVRLSFAVDNATLEHGIKAIQQLSV